MSMQVIKPGLADAFYDKGRYGYQHLGINPGGAMDPLALQVANALVLNAPNETVLEMHFPAATIQFTSPAIIALSGADFSAIIDDQPAPINTPVVVAKGSTLQCKRPATGARLYLAVKGGFNLKPWLQSGATNQVCKAGGYNGRNLEAGDLITLKLNNRDMQISDNHPTRVLPFCAHLNDFYHHEYIPFIPGPNFSQLASGSRELLMNEVFKIAPESSRMGYRLSGPALLLKQPASLLSTAVTNGTIQLLPSGQLIVLMADHQTTGGYPVVGYVASASLPALAQYNAGQSIRFKAITIAQAEAAAMRQYRHLLQLQNACTLRIKPFLQNAVGRS